MRHRRKVKKLGRTAAHRKAMLRNLVCSLFLLKPKEDGPRRVTTTVPKAKEGRRLAERAITLGKRATLHARRQAISLLGNKAVVKTLFNDVAPLYNGRNGGYTRIIRLGKSRLGDGAELCYFELVSEPVEAAAKPSEPVAPVVAQPPEPKTAETGADGPPGGEAGSTEEPAS